MNRSSRGARRWVCRLALGAAGSLALASAAQANIIYVYDGQGRVIEADYDNGFSVYYAYDAAGNRTSMIVMSGSTYWGHFTWGQANWNP
jgi:YD repeat-containing protein